MRRGGSSEWALPEARLMPRRTYQLIHMDNLIAGLGAWHVPNHPSQNGFLSFTVTSSNPGK